MSVARRTAIAVVLLGVAAAGARWAGGGSGGPPKDDGPAVVAVPVERRTLRETVVTRGTAGFKPLGVVRAAVSGRVTKVETTTGGQLSAGQAVVAIDGRPVVAVAAAVPFWRELARDAQGDDVRQLETVLAAEGFRPGRVDGSFSASTEAALKAWQKRHGLPQDGILRPGDVVVGSWPARVGRLRVAVGDFVNPGAELATLTEPHLTVTIELSPSDRVLVKPGQRVIVEVSATGRSTGGSIVEVTSAPEAASATGQQGADGSSGGQGGGQGSQGAGRQQQLYKATVAVEQPLEAVEGAGVRAEVLLEEARDTLAVPIAAIVSDGAGRASVRIQPRRGALRTVAVTTGLKEGAYVQVTSGVRIGDRVVLGVAPGGGLADR